MARDRTDAELLEDANTVYDEAENGLILLRYALERGEVSESEFKKQKADLKRIKRVAHELSRHL